MLLLIMFPHNIYLSENETAPRNYDTDKVHLNSIIKSVYLE